MLKLKSVENCFYPNTVEEGVKILKDKKESARVVGGGLHLTAFPNPQIESLIFLNNLKLNYVVEEANYIRIGATTTISEMSKAEPIKKLLDGKLREALSRISSELLRNQITIGGSIAQREPYSDIATLFLSLNAEVVYNDGTEHSVNLNEFYNLDFRSILKESIITEVRFKKFDNSFKFGMERYVRNATDIALFNMAILVKLDNGTIKEVFVSYGSRPMPAIRFEKLEAFLLGKTVEEVKNSVYEFAKDNVDVKGDIRASETYRRELAGIFAKRILSSF